MVMSSNQQQAVIRRRAVPSTRRRDGLIRYARDITSQNGEDGVIAQIFALIPPSPQPTTKKNTEQSGAREDGRRWCVDVGAWDGVHLSNTHSLLVPKVPGREDKDNDESRTSSSTTTWRGVLVEADTERFEMLRQLHEPLGNFCVHASVSGMQGSDNSLHNLLLLLRHQKQPPIPHDVDFVCVDIDGSDYWVLHDLLESQQFRPKVICIEFNPTMPNDLVYIPARHDAVRHGASLAALVELADMHGYVLVETTLFNAFFVEKPLYNQFLVQLVPDTSIEALHECTMGTSMYQLYDGTLKLWGCKRMLWHRLPMDERKLQILPPEKRSFPFAPDMDLANDDDFDVSMSVDMSPYCCKDGATYSDADRDACSQLLLQQLQQDGFCYVRGTGIQPTLCRDALAATQAFLQDASEDVRRSCLTKDRARRGYSPMCTENFASLLGRSDGPNDLVRKFRMGPPTPEESGATDGSSTNSSAKQSSFNSLLQPNVWPHPQMGWGHEDEAHFRDTMESYYQQASAAAETVVSAICHGLIQSASAQEVVKLQASLGPLTGLGGDETNSAGPTSSILTLLGYRHGSRHKGKNKGPLVAAHTDVGVATFLLFDQHPQGCAALERKNPAFLLDNNDTVDEWVEVKLPRKVLDDDDDPVFVLNVADCLSDLSRGRLPSTLHRVVARPKGHEPRTCCALFMGLNPDAQLVLPSATGSANGGDDEDDDEEMTYEEWRKRRIARAQNALKS